MMWLPIIGTKTSENPSIKKSWRCSNPLTQTLTMKSSIKLIEESESCRKVKLFTIRLMGLLDTLKWDSPLILERMSVEYFKMCQSTDHTCSPTMNHQLSINENPLDLLRNLWSIKKSILINLRKPIPIIRKNTLRYIM